MSTECEQRYHRSRKRYQYLLLTLILIMSAVTLTIYIIHNADNVTTSSNSTSIPSKSSSLPSTEPEETLSADAANLLKCSSDRTPIQYIDFTVANFWGAATNQYEGVPMNFSYPDDDTTYLEISVNYGQFIDGRYDIINGDFNLHENNGSYGQSFILEDTQRTIYWINYFTDQDTGDTTEIVATDIPSYERIDPETGAVTYCITDPQVLDSIYVTVIYFHEEHIVAYAVAKVIPIPEYRAFRFWLIESEYYPPTDGVYQDISREFIDQQISNAKS